MRKQYSLHIAVLLCGLHVMAPDVHSGQAEDAAVASSGSVYNKLGNEGGINANASQPITAGSKMYTMDGTKDGYAQITKPSSTSFLNIVVQPAGTGDLQTVQIAQDLNFDGTTDNVYSVPVPVSGVCANGLISCQPGTWLNCTPYTWVADSTGRISLATTMLKDLGGCYCINQSCGSTLAWDNVSQILHGLGGGISATMQQGRPGLTITDAKVDGTSIVYYGQDTTAGTKDKSGTLLNSNVAETKYYGAPGIMTSDAETMMVSQSSDPNSYYSGINDSLMNRGSDSDYIDCDIQRVTNLVAWCSQPISTGTAQASGACGAAGAQSPTVVFNWQITYKLTDKTVQTISGTESRTLCTDHLMFTRFINAGGGVDIQWAGTDPGGGTIGWNCGGVYSSWMTIKSVSLPADVKEWEGRINMSYSGGGCNTGSAVVTGYWCDQTCSIDESINDHCLALTQNKDCSLREEVVDSVQTYLNYQPTGLVPLPSSKSYSAYGCTQNITRDWWVKNRKYLCKTEKTYTFDDAKTRIAAVSTSATDNGSTFTYTDKRKDSSGAWVTDSTTSALPNAMAVDDCQKVCKVKTPVQDTQVAQTGPTTEIRTGNDSFTIDYRVCTATGCPVSPGESIEKDCQCTSDFAEAAGIMHSLDAAAKDITCSDGVKK